MAVMSKPLNRMYVVSSKEKEKMNKNKVTKEKWEEIMRQANLLNNKKDVK